MTEPRGVIPVDRSRPTSSGPRVSVVIRTCRGRRGFLADAVASAFGQSYREVEVVIVEDGTYEAEAWAESLPVPEGKSLVFRSLPKGGRCRTGNAGLEIASGTFAMFLDDDDRLYEDHVARLITPLLEDESLVAAYSAAHEVPTHVESREPLRVREGRPYVVYREPFSRERLAARNLMAIQSVLFRRELFDRLGGFRDDLDVLEDWDLWKRYAEAGEFVFVDRVTSMYRVAGDAETARGRQLVLDDQRLRVDAAHPRPLSLRLRRSVFERAWLYRCYWHGRQWYFRLKNAA